MSVLDLSCVHTYVSTRTNPVMPVMPMVSTHIVFACIFVCRHISVKGARDISALMTIAANPCMTPHHLHHTQSMQVDHRDTLSFLLENKADVNQINLHSGNSALLNAIMSRYVSVGRQRVLYMLMCTRKGLTYTGDSFLAPLAARIRGIYSSLI